MDGNLVGVVGEGEVAYEEIASPKVSLRAIVRWVVYIGVFLLPLWFLPLTYDILEFNKEILLFIVAGVGLVLYLIDMIKQGVLRYKPQAFYWPFAGFVVAAIISVIFSVNRYTSLFGTAGSRGFSLIGWVSLAILFFLVLNITEDRGKTLRAVLVSSLSLTLLVGVLQALGFSMFSGAFGKAAFNTVGSLNTIGFLATASLPLFMIPFTSEKRGQKVLVDILRYAGIVAVFFFLVLINWGPLWIVTFATILAYVGFTAFTGIQEGKMKFYAIPMAVIIFGIFLWLINFSWGPLKAKFPVEVAPKHATSYQIAFDALKEKPLGYGLENYIIAYDQFRPKQSVNNTFFQARFTDSGSEFATMLAEGGIPMLLVFLVFLVFYMKTLVRQIRLGFNNNSTEGKLWASSLGLLLVFFLYPVSLSIIAAFVVVLALAMLAAERDGDERVINLESKNIYSLTGSVVFIVGLVGVLVGGYFLASQYVANAELASAAALPNGDQKVATLVSSINNYSHDSRTYQLLTQTLLAQIAEDLKIAQTQKIPAEFAERLKNRLGSVVNVADRSTVVSPADSDAWMNSGYVYQNLIGLVGNADSIALEKYKQALVLSPANALAYVRNGNIHLTLADNAGKNVSRDVVNSHLDKAEENYKSAIALYGNYGQALYNLAAVYDRNGQVPQAIKQFEKLIPANPRDPSLLFQLGLLYYRNSQKEQAFQAWKQAVALFPDYSNARWYLSLVLEERGDLTGALDQVKSIEKLNPDSQLVKDRLAKLDAGIRVIPPGTVLGQQPLNNAQ